MSKHNVKTSCNYNLVPSLSPKKKILLILAKDSLKIEIETFWEELKKPFMYAIQNSYNIKQLRQAVIKLVEKKRRDLTKTGDLFRYLMLILS